MHMKQRVFLFLFGAAFLIPTVVDAAPVKATMEVSGWIPYWREVEGTADVIGRLDYVTTIHPFGYTFTEDGILNDAMGIADEPWKTLIAEAKKKKVRVIPTIMSGNGELLHRILSNSKTRIALEDEIAALVKREGFDGIDIDFEAKLAETKPYFSLFLKGLYQRMGNKWVYCTIESRTPLDSRYEGTPPQNAGIYANDFVQINKYCDRVQIMAYDQGSIDVKLNALGGPYVPVADAAWVEKVMKLAAKTISKRKLVLGIPTYGYEYGVTPLSVSGYRYERKWAFNQKYALDLAAQYGVVPSRNRAGEMSFSYIPVQQTTPSVVGVPVESQAVGPAVAAQQPFNIVWWSDAIAVAQKMAIAKKLGLRGVAIFKFDGGEDQRIWDTLQNGL